MSIFKRGKKWYYNFPRTITPSGKRERGVIPTARIKSDAEEAERKMLREIHEGTFGMPKGTIPFKEFVHQHYLPWAKVNKKSWKIDTYRVRALIATFGDKQLRQISPFDIEAYKIKRLKEPIVSRHKDETKRKLKPRKPAAVNREILLLSRIFRLAVTFRKEAANPCSEVKLLEGERTRERYMTPEEEELLMPVLVGNRAHLREMVILAVNTGLRQMELLKMKHEQVDFYRDELIIFETNANPTISLFFRLFHKLFTYRI